MDVTTGSDETRRPPISCLDLIFLGTSSASPTKDRNVQSSVLRFDGTVIMVDCGEGTQHQILRTAIRPGKIEHIFITHLHGDHVFGLPGLFCSISHNSTAERPPLVLWGPRGLRRFVRNALIDTNSHLSFTWTVNELFFKDDPQEMAVNEVRHPNEAAGVNIRPDEWSNGSTWSLLSHSQYSFRVVAAEMDHGGCPCVGYCFEEREGVGNLNVGKLRACGLSPGPICKLLKSGQSVETATGRSVSPEEVIDPAPPGRKVVIMGDTSSSAAMEPLAMNCDMVVHESTYGEDLHDQAIHYGHSTARMAASFALKVNAKQLFLTHFSARYRLREQLDESDTEGSLVIEDLVAEARSVFETTAAALDLMVVPLLKPERQSSSLDEKMRKRKRNEQ